MAICKALVVEHDAKTRETIEDILTMLDFDYEFADSLSQARKLLARAEYDLVLPASNMPSRTGSCPRPQSAEHFMLSLRRFREENMPKVVMLMPERPTATHEDIARWAFEMRDLGVTDVILKPLADEGRTLDRVIKKVMGLKGEQSVPGASAADPSAFQPTLGLIVPKDKIAANGEYNLSGERYREGTARATRYAIAELGEVAEVIAGQSPPGESYNTVGTGVPFYQGKTEFGEMYIGVRQRGQPTRGAPQKLAIF